MSKPNLNVDDFEYVLSEAIRFHEGYSGEKSLESRQQFLAGEPKMSFFAKISTPSRDVIIGMNAHNRFFTIADRILNSRKDKTKLISRSALVDALKVEFAKIVFEQQKPIDPSSVSKIVDVAVNVVSKEFQSICHYLPIVFFHDFKDEELSFDSVVFISKDRFLADYVTEENLTAHDYVDKEDLSNYLASATAILEIRVPPCDPQFSERRAYICAKIMLSIFKLFLGRSASKLVLCDGVKSGRYSFQFSKKEKLNIKMSCNLSGASHAEWRSILSLEEENLSKLFSLALSHVLEPKPMEVLANRVVDSLWWFGEAFDDQDVHSRVVKYTTAIERLLTTSKDEVTQKVVNRGSKAIAIFEGQREYWRKLISDLYDLRSKIVHGSYSISNSVDDPSDYWAQELAKKIIMGMTIIFYRLEWDSAHKNTTLDEFFLKLESYPDKEL